MPKQAKLGFRILKQAGEMMIPDERDFESHEENKKYRSHQLEKARKLRCYHKNKHRYNKQKRAVARSISGRYKDAERLAAARSQGWEFTQEEWERVWRDAGWVRIPGTQSAHNPQGDIVPAFALRGSHRYKNTCMQRKNARKPWSAANCKIMFRGEELSPKSQWYVNPNKHNLMS